MMAKRAGCERWAGTSFAVLDEVRLGHMAPSSHLQLEMVVDYSSLPLGWGGPGRGMDPSLR